MSLLAYGNPATMAGLLADLLSFDDITVKYLYGNIHGGWSGGLLVVGGIPVYGDTTLGLDPLVERINVHIYVGKEDRISPYGGCLLPGQVLYLGNVPGQAGIYGHLPYDDVGPGGFQANVIEVDRGGAGGGKVIVWVAGYPSADAG